MKNMKKFAVILLVAILALQGIAMADTEWYESGGHRYLNTKGGPKITGWYQEGDNWYYINDKGFAATGWFRLTTGIYHTNEDGLVDEGWQRYNGIWYTLRPVNIGTEEEPRTVLRWYYIDGSDEFPAGSRVLHGHTYNVVNKKEALHGWVKSENDLAYFNEDGTADTGWKEIDGAYYYFDVTGRATRGTKNVNGAHLSFDYKTGALRSKLPEGTAKTALTANTPGTITKGQVNVTDVPEEKTTNTEQTAKTEVTTHTETKAKVETKEETVTEDILYGTIYQDDPNRDVSEGEKVIQEGRNGKKTTVYTVTYTNGVATNREVKDTQTVAAVDKIISRPTKQAASTNPAPVSGGTDQPAPVITTSEETKTESIAFETETQNDPSRLKGDADKVIQEGQNGEKTITYTVTYTDGVETSRQVSSESITKQPVKKIISHATGDYTTKTVTETVEIPYDEERREDNSLYKGEESVGRSGSNGEKTITYEIKYDPSGNQVSKTAVSEEVTKSPVPQVVLVGTFVPTFTTSVVSISPSGPMGTRDSSIDAACVAWAQSMANNNKVEHSGPIGAESVGAWGSASAAASGVIAHGGEVLRRSERWGAGCVSLTETLPGGGTHTIYFATARGEGAYLDE